MFKFMIHLRHLGTNSSLICTLLSHLSSFLHSKFIFGRKFNHSVLLHDNFTNSRSCFLISNFQIHSNKSFDQNSTTTTSKQTNANISKPISNESSPTHSPRTISTTMRKYRKREYISADVCPKLVECAKKKTQLHYSQVKTINLKHK